MSVRVLEYVPPKYYKRIEPMTLVQDACKPAQASSWLLDSLASVCDRLVAINNANVFRSIETLRTPQKFTKKF